MTTYYLPSPDSSRPNALHAVKFPDGQTRDVLYVWNARASAWSISVQGLCTNRLMVIGSDLCDTKSATSGYSIIVASLSAQTRDPLLTDFDNGDYRVVLVSA